MLDINTQKEFSVTELSRAIQLVVQQHFTSIVVRGEISGLKRHTSGHLYLSLKDDQSVIDAVCWRGIADSLRHQPEEGLEVICRGRVTTYPARSKYQFLIESLEPAGVGALLKLLEERKAKLAAEGLFDAARKKPLPKYPRVIGVITSETGVVIQDILHRLRERFPVQVLLWPVTVQGSTAVADITEALVGFQNLPPSFPIPDLLILARGGGSLEDLWTFNEEAVVRAVASCRIPLITAVGHETDTTLVDYASDYRAPTPTAAAEIAVPHREHLLDLLHKGEERLTQGIRRHIKENSLILHRHRLIHPRRIVDEKTLQLDERFERLCIGARHLLLQKKACLGPPLTANRFFQQLGRYREKMVFLHTRLSHHIKSIVGMKTQKFETLCSLATSYSYTKTLERGFVLVQKNGILASSAAALHSKDIITLRFHDGTQIAEIK